MPPSHLIRITLATSGTHPLVGNINSQRDQNSIFSIILLQSFLLSLSLLFNHLITPRFLSSCLFLLSVRSFNYHNRNHIFYQSIIIIDSHFYHTILSFPHLFISSCPLSETHSTCKGFRRLDSRAINSKKNRCRNVNKRRLVQYTQEVLQQEGRPYYFHM